MSAAVVRRGLGRLATLIGGASFPAWFLAALAGLELVLLVALLVPAGAVGAEGFEGFARDFKVWCFGYDPETGSLSIGWVLATFTEPLLLAAIIGWLWSTPLRETWKARRSQIVGAAGVGLATVFAAAAVLSVDAANASNAVDTSAFPGDRIRRAVPTPEIALVDQDGKTVELSALRGRVVVITAVYTRCGSTCPMLLSQAKRVLEAVGPERRRDVTMLAITLDPEHDTPASMVDLARRHTIAAPEWHLLTGDPAVVSKTLDRLDIPRSKDMQTGVINHANVFVVVDREGREAFRMSLGEQQEQWLAAAIIQLVDEGRTP